MVLTARGLVGSDSPTLVKAVHHPSSGLGRFTRQTLASYAMSRGERDGYIIVADVVLVATVLTRFKLLLFLILLLVVVVVSFHP